MFKHLKKLEVSDNTAKLTLNDIQGAPTLVMKPATEVNKPYFNAVLRQNGGKQAQSRGRMPTKKLLQMVEKNRENDRSLFPKHVVVGWESMPGDDGNMVEFSEGACKEFFSYLPVWLLDEIRNFASDLSNFIEQPEDVEGQAKN